MPDTDFFSPKSESYPIIYAYKHTDVKSHEGYIKVGYTTKTAEERVYEIEHTSAVPYEILKVWPAMRSDGSCFTDHDVHAVLRKKGFRRLNEGKDRNEWFRCGLDDIEAAIIA